MVVLNRKVLTLSSVLALSACGSLDKKFEETRYINLAPFSENIVVMANDLNYGFDNIRTLHSKWYFDRKSQKLKQLLKLERKVTDEIHFIVEYSSRIVFLSEANIPISDKTKELSRFIDKMHSRFSDSSDLIVSKEQKNSIIASIKQKDKFIHALQAAQPIINELSRHAEQLLDNLKKAEQNLATHQYNKIEAENNHIRLLIQSLKKNEIEISSAIVLLNDYADGNILAIDELMKSKVLLEKPEIQSKKSLSRNQIGLLKKHLLNRLTENTNFYRQVEPSYNRYLLAQKELLGLVKEHDAEIRKSRLIFIAFASAHRKMSSGVVKPAEWFDIKETPKLILKLLPI